VDVESDRDSVRHVGESHRFRKQVEMPRNESVSPLLHQQAMAIVNRLPTLMNAFINKFSLFVEPVMKNMKMVKFRFGHKSLITNEFR